MAGRSLVLVSRLNVIPVRFAVVASRPGIDWARGSAVVSVSKHLVGVVVIVVVDRLSLVGGPTSVAPAGSYEIVVSHVAARVVDPASTPPVVLQVEAAKIAPVVAIGIAGRRGCRLD